jgi:ABC-type multidrug transport system ATPase subunit
MLGLLGPNGAGKSTTFKLLTSQEQPTTGKVFLEGKLHQPYEYTFKSMGICYQDDTMWEKLSAEEILKVFGHLVGVKNIKSESEWLFDKLEMENVRRSFEYLSGGNKRKCCMAVCLIGQPRSKFLD